MMTIAMAAAASAFPAAERAALMDAARPAAEADLGLPVRFVVTRLERQGEWAFLLATMQNPHGRPVDLARSKRASAAREGMVSNVYAALLRRRDGHWVPVDHATGPTDVAWEDWADKHGAPRAVFGR